MILPAICWELYRSQGLRTGTEPVSAPPATGEPRQSLSPPSRSERRDPLARPASGSDEREASVSLLDVRSRRAPMGTHWALEPSGPAAEPARVEREVTGEPWRLMAGDWRLACLDAELETLARKPISLVPGENLVWVGAPTRLEVAVVDRENRPIADATVRWVVLDENLDPLGTRGFWDEGDVVAAATTDSAGCAELGAPVARPGVLFITAEGFCNAERPVLGPASLRVTLEQVASLPADLQAIGAFSGNPLPGVRAWGREGPVTAISGLDGSLRFVSEAGSSEPLRAMGDAILPTAFEIEDLNDRRLVVHERGRLSIVVTDVEGQVAADAMVTVVAGSEASEGPEGSEASGPVLLEPVARPAEGGGFEATVALGHRVVVLASSGSASAEASLVPDAPHESVTIRLAPAEGLRVRLPDRRPEGSTAVAVVELANRLKHRVGERGDSIEIPHPEHVRRIRVSVEGHAPLELKPRAGAPGGLERSGDLAPRWREAHRVRLLLEDERGEPVAGAFMRFSWRTSPVREYPDLHGFEPTDHPAWIQRVSARLGGTTDAAGRLTLRLPEGSYTVFVSPDSKSRVPSFGVAYQVAYTAEVRAAGEQRWTVPGMRLATVHAYHPSGAPVERIRIGVPGMLSGSHSECAGNRWQGWIAARAEEVFVTALPSGDVSRVPIDEPSTDPIELVTTIGGKDSAIRLVGETGGLAGELLEVTARSSSEPGAPALWSARIKVEDPAWIPLDIPADSAAVELSPVRKAGSTWDFTPKRQIWYPATVLEFVAENTPH